MKFNIPGLELVEPLRPRPAFGAAIGGATGLMFGLLSLGKVFAASEVGQVLGYTVGALLAGALIGAGQRLLRRRWTAGLVVSFAVAVGFFTAARFWQKDVWLVEATFMGIVGGLIYAFLLWDYRGSQATAETGSSSRNETDQS